MASPPAPICVPDVWGPARRLPALEPKLRAGLAELASDPDLPPRDEGLRLTAQAAALRLQIWGVTLPRRWEALLPSAIPIDFYLTPILSEEAAAAFLEANPGLADEVPDFVELGVGWWLFLAGPATLGYSAPELVLMNALTAVVAMYGALATRRAASA